MLWMYLNMYLVVGNSKTKKGKLTLNMELQPDFSGAITFVELGLMFPRNGGLMIYLRKTFGGCMSFLSCWLLHVLLGGLRKYISRKDER